MAAGTKCRMRMEKYTDNGMNLRYLDAFNPALNRLKQRFTKLYLIRIDYEAAFANGLTETSAPNAVFNGTSTPATVFVVSSDAKDTVAGVGVQKVRLFGIGETGLFQTEDISMSGTTDVETSNKWQRVFHLSAIQWGTELDAAGTIIVEDDAAATHTYLTIGAGANESDGAAIWVPSGYYLQIQQMKLTLTTSANANASLIAQVGFNNFDTSGTDPDLAYEQIRASIHSNTVLTGCSSFHTADGLSKVTISDTYKGAAETGHLTVIYLVMGA